MNRLDLMQAHGQYPPPPGESEILGVEGRTISSCIPWSDPQGPLEIVLYSHSSSVQVVQVFHQRKSANVQFVVSLYKFIGKPHPP